MLSLQRQLLLAVGVVACGAVIAVGIAARQTTRVEFQKFQRLVHERQMTDGSDVMARVRSALDGACCTDAAMGAAKAALEEGQGLLVLDQDGAVRGVAGLGVDASALRATYKGGVLHLETTDVAPGRNSGVTLDMQGGPSVPIRLADGRAGSAHLLPALASGLAPADQFLGSVDRRLLVAGLLVAALAIVATWVTTRRIVGPIAELRDATRALAEGQLSRRVSVGGATEIAELGRGFNTMAAELERQETLRRNLVHDVAHELRRPLTSLRCRLETAIDGLSADPQPTLRQLNDDVSHLSQLVGDLDDLARAEAGDLKLAIADVDVADVCRSAIRAANLEQDSRVRLDVDDALVVRGDVVRVRQILVNLLTNADRHTPADGTITVKAHAREREATIEVHNTGSALAPEELERVFDRFYRADPSRQRATGGSGLGLAIVKHLTELQAGRVWASSDASGVTVGVGLPLALAGSRSDRIAIS